MSEQSGEGAYCCPNCGSEDTWIGFIADYDTRCEDCRHLYDIRTGDAILV